MKKKAATLIFLNLAIIIDVMSQTNFEVEIPQQFARQFKMDEQRYLDSTNPADLLAGSAFNLWNGVIKGEKRGYNLDSLYAIFKDLHTKALLRKCSIIRLHPGGYASLYYFNIQLLNSSWLTPDSLLAVYSSLNKDLRETPLGKFVLQSINRKQSLQLGKEMPLFVFKSSTSKQLNISSFRGHSYVLLCFWASWCGPCVKNIPLLQKIEETYRPKGLQVISISIDENVSNWQAALNKHPMSWLQTCDLPIYSSNRIRTLYEIHFVPQYFLIDKQGKLIYQTFLPDHDDDSYSRLNDTLQKKLDKQQD